MLEYWVYFGWININIVGYAGKVQSVPKRFAWIVRHQSGATMYNCLRQLSIYTMLHAKFLG